jgi:hypothetical protein
MGAPIDAGVPREPGFWLGRAWWIALCLVMVTPVMAAVVAFETRRQRVVPQTTSGAATIVGGLALCAGIVTAMALGAQPGAALGLVGVGTASVLLRTRRGPRSREDQVAAAPRSTP